MKDKNLIMLFAVNKSKNKNKNNSIDVMKIYNSIPLAINTDSNHTTGQLNKASLFCAFLLSSGKIKIPCCNKPYRYQISLMHYGTILGILHYDIL